MSTGDLAQVAANFDAHIAGIISEPEVTPLKPNLNKLSKKNKSNSELISKRVCKDLSYYYSLTNVKYYMDDDEEDSRGANAKCLSSSLSSISSAKSTSLSSAAGGNKTSSDNDDNDLELFSNHYQPPSLQLEPPAVAHSSSKAQQIPFYKLQKSITLPNANEMAQFANTQTMGFSKTSSMNASSSLNSNNMSCEGVIGVDDDYYDENGQIDEEEQLNMDSNKCNFPTEPIVGTRYVNQQYQQQQQQRHHRNTPAHKSLSEYCVTSSRYILNRFRKYKNYRHFRCSTNRCSKLSKSMSMNKRG
jgi:hypothetical protein